MLKFQGYHAVAFSGAYSAVIEACTWEEVSFDYLNSMSTEYFSRMRTTSLGKWPVFWRASKYLGDVKTDPFKYEQGHTSNSVMVLHKSAGLPRSLNSWWHGRWCEQGCVACGLGLCKQHICRSQHGVLLERPKLLQRAVGVKPGPGGGYKYMVPERF